MPRFSIVYPTRHRPEFVEQALSALALQKFDDFEVIVSDNYANPASSCESVCRDTSLQNLIYVRPPSPTGMVANWNFAVSHASGEYVCVLTDKMMFLPDALTHINRCLRVAGHVDIVNWVSDAYDPTGSDSFAGGRYTVFKPHPRILGWFKRYSPRRELDCKGNAEVSRREQSTSEYCRGKIVFGMFHRDLIARISRKYGALFHNISPDYTSMILGLYEAKDAIELSRSIVASVNTGISNGYLCDVNDSAALEYLCSLDGRVSEIFEHMLVPGLYAAQSNVVAHDYLAMMARHGLIFKFDKVNWLVYCMEEIERTSRQWSSAEVAREQKDLLMRRVAKLSDHEKQRLDLKLRTRICNARASVDAGNQRSFASESLQKAIISRTRFMIRDVLRPLFNVLDRFVGRSTFLQRTVMSHKWPGRDTLTRMYRRLK